MDGHHAHIDPGEMKKCEKACLDDSRVQAAIEASQLPEGATVVCEPWTYSPDGMNDMTRRCVIVRDWNNSAFITRKDADVEIVLFLYEVGATR